jgi:hypothetical protein
VADYKKSLGVTSSRIASVGLGESNPVSTNDTDEDRQQNRRVEVAIVANDEMKKAAENGTLNKIKVQLKQINRPGFHPGRSISGISIPKVQTLKSGIPPPLAGRSGAANQEQTSHAV